MRAAEGQVNFTDFAGMLTAAQGTPGESWFSGVSGEMGAAERQVNYTELAAVLTAAQGTPGDWFSNGKFARILGEKSLV